MTTLRGAVPESPAGSLAIDADRAPGVIYVESKGIWNEQIVRRYFVDLETLLRSLISAVYVETDRVATLVSVDLRRVSVVQRVYGVNRKLFDDPPQGLVRWGFAALIS